MKKYTLLLFTLLFCTLQVAVGQNRTITGVVSDDYGPLAGAFVFEKNNQSNAVTVGADGRYSLTLKGTGNIIVYQMFGLLTKEVNIAGRTRVDVTLEADVKGLEEVSVIAYGTKSRVTQTGATSQISGAEIRQNPSASLQNTLMGRLPGFISQQRSGQPGNDAANFSIRGANSFTGTVSALVIVDDIEYGQPLSDIDPDQIESITILKDASTTAIFGAKGANGVILITTKRGIPGKAQVSFRTETGLQSPTFPLKFLNSFQAATLENQARANSNLAPYWSQESLDHFQNGTDPYGHPDVDWSETILRKHSNQVRNNLNISGGTEKAKYFVTLGHLYQNGILKDFSTKESEFNSNYYYKRYNFRSNIDIKATKSLNLTVDMTGYMGEQNNPWLRGTANNPFFELNDFKRLAPFAYPVYNPDGSFGGNNNLSRMANLAYNIVGRMQHLGYQRAFENGIVANVTARQDLSAITKGLSIRGVIGISNANSYSRNLERGAFPSFVYNSVANTYTPFDPNNQRLPRMTLTTDPGRMNRRFNYQGDLRYDRTFSEKHHVYALALYNQYTRTPGSVIPESFRGLSLRTGYDYKQKYIVEFVAGYNGSDKFPKDLRYEFFPAASIGWNIAEEGFFKNNIKFIDLFKLRASYGFVGDDAGAPPAGSYVSQFYGVSTGAYNFGEAYNSTGNNQSMLNEGALSNPLLKWETEEATNIGVDINAFKGKLRFTGDVFRRYRTDILRGRQSVPEYAGVAFGTANYAVLDTRGYEMDATYRDRIGQFNFSLNGNISVAKTIMVRADEAMSDLPYQRQTGGYMGRTLGYVWDGFYTPENIDASVKPNIPVFPGDLRYKDLNGNGVIDLADRMLLEYPNLPSHIYGMNLAASYKGISLAVSLQAATRFTLRSQSTQIVPGISNFREIHLDTWTPENRDAALPRLTNDWNSTVNSPVTYVSDFWNIRGDYLRIRSAELSYSFPQELTKRVFLNGLRVYANGNNLYTWMLKSKNIYNLDPESANGSSIQSYPQQKIWNFGLQVTF